MNNGISASARSAGRRPRGLSVTVRSRRYDIRSRLGGTGRVSAPRTDASRFGRRGGCTMKIVVIGGSGLIGSKLVTKLRDHDHEAVAASPKSGVNALTGEGLAEGLEGAAVVVDVSNSPSFEDAAVLEFFETSTRNLLAAEGAGGRRPSRCIVGRRHRAPVPKRLLPREDRPGAADQGAARSPTRSSARRSSSSSSWASPTAATDGNTVRLAPVLIQPMAAEDVAVPSARVSVGSPVNGIVEVAGPEQFRLDEFIRRAPERRRRSA